ncbi:glutamyl-tRNA reductase [Bacteroidota bacterium]
MNGEKLKLVVVGINYKTSTILDREKFQISRNEIPDVLRYFKSRDQVEGSVIISTCNRLEFYLVLKHNNDPFSLINDYYLHTKGIDIMENRSLFYLYSQSDVAKHIFNVISGLDSMLIGEYQIQGQIKDAYSITCSEKTADKILHKLFHAAFRAGKRIRNQTKIGTGKQSLSGVAFEIITEQLEKKDVITIIGINESTKILTEKISQSGFTNLNFINRTLYKAEELANKYSGTAYSFGGMEESIAKSKCIFSCTSAQEYIISSDLLNKIYKRSANPQLVIDMAIPRDIDTNNIAKDIKVFDLEGLNNYLKDQRGEITLDLPRARKIISEEVNLFEVWSESQNDDVLGPFAEKIELMRLQLLDETKVQFTDDEFHALEKFSRSITHRMKSIFNQVIKINNIKKENNNL